MKVKSKAKQICKRHSVLLGNVMTNKENFKEVSMISSEINMNGLR